MQNAMTSTKYQETATNEHYLSNTHPNTSPLIIGRKATAQHIRSTLRVDANQFVPGSWAHNHKKSNKLNVHATEFIPTEIRHPKTALIRLDPTVNDFVPAANLPYQPYVFHAAEDCEEEIVTCEHLDDTIVQNDEGSNGRLHMPSTYSQTKLNECVLFQNGGCKGQLKARVSFPGYIYPLCSSFPLPGPPAQNPPRLFELTPEMREGEQHAFRLWWFENLHHINYFGQAVHASSSTPPAVSLVVIMSSPRFFYVERAFDIRKAAILSRAMVWVDPIIYYGPRNVLRNLKGSALQNAAIGYCEVFYDECGEWYNDFGGDDISRPATDFFQGAENRPEAVLLNGFSESESGRTRRDYIVLACRENLAEDIARQESRKQRRLRYGRRESCLSTAVSIDEVSEDDTVASEPEFSTGLHTYKEEWQAKFDIRFGPPLSNWADEIDENSPQPLPTTAAVSDSVISSPEINPDHTSQEVQESVDFQETSTRRAFSSSSSNNNHSDDTDTNHEDGGSDSIPVTPGVSETSSEIDAEISMLSDLSPVRKEVLDEIIQRVVLGLVKQSENESTTAMSPAADAPEEGAMVSELPLAEHVNDSHVHDGSPPTDEDQRSIDGTTIVPDHKSGPFEGMPMKLQSTFTLPIRSLRRSKTVDFSTFRSIGSQFDHSETISDSPSPRQMVTEEEDSDDQQFDTVSLDSWETVNELTEQSTDCLLIEHDEVMSTTPRYSPPTVQDRPCTPPLNKKASDNSPSYGSDYKPSAFDEYSDSDSSDTSTPRRHARSPFKRPESNTPDRMSSYVTYESRGLSPIKEIDSPLRNLETKSEFEAAKQISTTEYDGSGLQRETSAHIRALEDFNFDLDKIINLPIGTPIRASDSAEGAYNSSPESRFLGSETSNATVIRHTSCAEQQRTLSELTYFADDDSTSSRVYLAPWDPIPDLWPDFDGVQPATFHPLPQWVPSEPAPVPPSEPVLDKPLGNQHRSKLRHASWSKIQNKLQKKKPAGQEEPKTPSKTKKAFKKGVSNIKKMFRKEVNILL